MDEEIEITVVGTRCVYINNHRVAGKKPYASECLTEWSFKTKLSEILAAVPSLTVKS